MNNEEQRSRGALAKAEQLVADGQIESAIDVLTTLGGRGFDMEYVKCLTLLVQLCLCTKDGEFAGKLDLTRATNRVKGGNQNIESDTVTMVNIVFDHYKKMVTNMQESIDSMTAEPSKEEEIITALTGIPVSERARERFFDRCQRAAENISRSLFTYRGISLGKKTFHIYIKYAVELITLCHSAGMREAVARASSTVAEALFGLIVKPIPTNSRGNLAQEITSNRNDFFNSTASCESTIRGLCQMLSFLAEEGNWTSNCWSVVTHLKNIADAVAERNSSMTGLRSEAYTRLGAIFWDCNVPTYHAYCLSVAARQHTASVVLPTRAVLAALACPELNEQHNSFASTYDSHAVHEEVVELFGEPNTSRSHLLSTLNLSGSIANADPLVRPLIAAFSGAPVADFAALYTTLTTLLAKDAAYHAYSRPVRLALLRVQMEQLSRTTTRADLQGLVMANAKLSEVEYLRDVEHPLLQDSAVPIEIDTRTKTVLFRNATQATILGSFTKMVAAVDPWPCASASEATLTPSGTAVANSRSNHVLRGISANDILEAQRQTHILHELQRDCDRSSRDRKEALEKKKIEEADTKIRERQDVEKARREKAQHVQYRKTLAEYRERQRQERCKMVLTKLRAKYPRFKVDNIIAEKSAAVFEDELTHALANFKRREVEGDSRDTLRGNLFERALRQLEIPKRKELERANAEQHKAERAAARKNMLEQHRKEYDRRSEERLVLQKFQDEARKYEERWSNTAATEKVSKRDEQQELLEREKRRLAGLE